MFWCAYFEQMVLERYYSKFGEETELVWPKNLELQEKIRKGPPEDVDFLSWIVTLPCEQAHTHQAEVWEQKRDIHT